MPGVTAGRCRLQSYLSSPAPELGYPHPSISGEPAYRPVQPALHSLGSLLEWRSHSPSPACRVALLRACPADSPPPRQGFWDSAREASTQGLEPVRVSTCMPPFLLLRFNSVGSLQLLFLPLSVPSAFHIWSLSNPTPCELKAILYVVCLPHLFMKLDCMLYVVPLLHFPRVCPPCSSL